jgi:hypothetical protein
VVDYRGFAWSGSFKSTCTRADVAAAFRRENYLPPELQFFEMRNKRGRIMDPKATLIQQDVRCGDCLDIEFHGAQAGTMAPIPESKGEYSAPYPGLRQLFVNFIKDEALGQVSCLDITYRREDDSLLCRASGN